MIAPSLKGPSSTRPSTIEDITGQDLMSDPFAHPSGPNVFTELHHHRFRNLVLQIRHCCRLPGPDLECLLDFGAVVPFLKQWAGWFIKTVKPLVQRNCPETKIRNLESVKDPPSKPPFAKMSICLRKLNALGARRVFVLPIVIPKLCKANVVQNQTSAPPLFVQTTSRTLA